MNKNNFLIGRGELLTYDVKGPRRPPMPKEVYTLREAQERLIPQIEITSKSLDSLPNMACPNDFAIAKFTLNPSFIARSYYPVSFLREAGLSSVGSRTVRIKPEKWKKKAQVTESSTTEIFVAGKRNAFRSLPDLAESFLSGTDEAIDFARFEEITPYLSQERIISSKTENGGFYEVGIHLLPDNGRDVVQQSFLKYADSLNVEVHTKLTFVAGGLWFTPVKCSEEQLGKLSEFSFIRVIRPVPQLRGMRPMQRVSSINIPCVLPIAEPISSEPKVAILDGGLPAVHPLNKWIKSYRVLDDNAEDDEGGLAHGLAVTSAFLFGPISPKNAVQRPYSYVDNLRILDKNIEGEDPLELYRTLGFIEEVLLSRQYQFLNLSLGPDLPIEDTEVHAWTAVIDDLLSDGETFMTVAAGNNGGRDRESGNARIQVPSDCVNAVAIGAANSQDEKNWQRAEYSAFGPGRSPGIIKPDLTAFGGDIDGYFHVIAEGSSPVITPQMGTSFSAPYALRSAVGIRSIMGQELSPLAIKALLVHAANTNGHHVTEVGWGKIPENLNDIITSPDGVARIVYQGELKPGKYLRAPLPLPNGTLNGSISLSATFCYASATDPQDSASYTKAGLEVSFRPNEDKSKSEGQTNADSKGFFELKKYATESERRSDMGKWETVLHNSKNMRGSSLKNPVFDIHYNARDCGGMASKPEKIRYALIITVKASKHADLYNEILRAYNQILIPLQPQVSLPLNV
ncbi:TPA: S8 family peptidase [Salmonella enterica]|nr:S8 family peptidase [Salmonella enterica]